MRLFHFVPALIFVVSLLSPSVTRADIVFVNLNLNFKEVEAARKAAVARHENFIVVPELSDAQIKILKNWKSQNNGDEELLRVFPPTGHLNIPLAIENALAAEDRAGRAVNSFVISSHHVNNFFGTVGKIEDLQLFGVLKKHASTQNLNGLYGWGCYTAEPQLVQEIKRDLPNLPIVAGWDGEAPTEIREADTNILTYLLEHESNALHAAATRKLRAFLKSIPDIGQNLGATNFGLAVCGRLESTHQSLDVGDPRTLCTKRAIHGDGMYSGLIMKKGNIYDSYSESKGVPDDLDHSDLREFYNMAQTYSICPEIQLFTKYQQFPTNEQIVHLIHFKNGFKNFFAYYKKDLQRMQKILNENHDPNGSRAPSFDFEHGNRQYLGYELNRFLKDVTSIAKSMQATSSAPFSLFTPHASQADIAFLNLMRSRISVLLVENKCMPDEWNDPPPASSAKLPAAPSQRCINGG